MSRTAFKLSHALVYALVAFIVGVVLTAIAFRFSPMADSNLSGISSPLRSGSDDTSYRPIVSPRSESIGTNSIDERLASIVGAKTLDDTLKLSSDFDQSVALFHRLAISDEAGVKKLLEESKSIGQTSQRDGAQQIIFARFASINPSEAVSYVSQFNPVQHRNLINVIFREWSRTDLDAAGEAATRLESLAHRDMAILAILSSRDDLSQQKLRELAENLGGTKLLNYVTSQSQARAIGSDPQSELSQAINSTEKGVRSRENIQRIAYLWVQAEGTSVLWEINNLLTDYPDRSQIIRTLVYQFALTQPENVLSFLQELPQKKSAANLAAIVFQFWAQTDVQAAFASASDFDLADSTHIHREAVISTWASRDPQAVLDLVDSLPSELKNSSIEKALTSMVTKTPSKAISYIDDVADISLKRKLTSSVGNRWAQMNPQAAADWILALPTEIADDRLKASTVAVLARENPDLALKLSARQQGNLALRMERVVMDSIAKQYIDKAINVLPQISIENQIHCATQIGYKLIKHDPQRALDLGGSLSENQRAEYFDQLISNWSYENPFRLISMLDELPSKQMTSTAALRIIRTKWKRGDLTNAQFDHVYSRLNAEDKVTTDRFLQQPYQNERRLHH